MKTCHIIIVIVSLLSGCYQDRPATDDDFVFDKSKYIDVKPIDLTPEPVIEPIPEPTVELALEVDSVKPTPAVVAREELWVFTDSTWCPKCAQISNKLGSALWQSVKDGYCVLYDDSLMKACDIRVWNVVDPKSPPRALEDLEGGDWGIPLIVLISYDGAVPTEIRRWDNKKEVTAALLKELITGRPTNIVTQTPQTTSSVEWDVNSLRLEIQKYARRTNRTRTLVRGTTVGQHLSGSQSLGHHGWPQKIIQQLSPGEQQLLHDADHEGVIKPRR